MKTVRCAHARKQNPARVAQGGFAEAGLLFGDDDDLISLVTSVRATAV